jgi:hypothetical protein
MAQKPVNPEATDEAIKFLEYINISGKQIIAGHTLSNFEIDLIT